MQAAVKAVRSDRPGPPGPPVDMDADLRRAVASSWRRQMMHATFRLTALALALFALVPVGLAQPIPPGSAERVIDVDGEALTAFTYRPTCQAPSLLIVLHGKGRNATGYRDYSRRLADTHCMMVVAPLLDAARFPRSRFGLGGLSERGVIQPPERWTSNVLLGLIGAVRSSEGRRMEYSLLGHSAGGQLLMRFAATAPNEARRIVIANPGTLVWADLSIEAPYGLGGLPAGVGDGEGLRRYLAQPISLYLGQDDTEIDDDLPQGTKAQQQGGNRLERGRTIFTAAEAKARELKIPFNWRLVEVAGVGHTARKMLGRSEASAALAP